MPKYLLFPVLFLFTVSTNLFAQPAQRDADYSSVDSLAISTRYKGDITKLTEELVGPFSGDHLKARAIFKWITDNIRYDYKYYNKYALKGREPKTYKCKDDKDCQAKRMVWETKYIERVLKRKKAVCQGYSMLFKKMCDIAGLRSQIVPGYVRTEWYQVGSPGSLDHVWNAVWLDTAYYLLDATWAAGGCGKAESGKLLHFKKAFKNYYWLTPAAEFARNHYPRDSKWVLEPGFTKEKFANNPYYAGDVIPDIRMIEPSSGIIGTRKGDTIRFKIEYRGNVKDLQINSNIFRNPDIWVRENVSKRRTKWRYDSLAVKKQRYITYRRSNDVYEFEYPVTDNSLYYLEILFDRKRVMRFKVVVNKQK